MIDIKKLQSLEKYNLIEGEQVVYGKIYYIEKSNVYNVMKDLLFREKAGYSFEWIDVHCEDKKVLDLYLFLIF